MLFVAGCKSSEVPGPTDQPPVVVSVASVEVKPGTASLFGGRTVQLTAIARDASGNALAGRAISWSTSSPAVLAVSSTGLVSAVSFGSATITATSEGATASATINVLHDPIVFVHGFESSGAIWSTMITRLKADGWTDAPLFTWSYDSNQSNGAIAQILQTKVDSLLSATGAIKVDVMPTRWVDSLRVTSRSRSAVAKKSTPSCRSRRRTMERPPPCCAGFNRASRCDRDPHSSRR
jgi:Bacterial Ig-like domain (group 2)/Lipase (class 2)